MLLHDQEVRRRCLASEPPLLFPFCEGHQEGVVSYGLTHAGYDLRLDTHVKVFKNTRNQVVDPKRFKDVEYAASMFDEYDVAPHEPITIPSGGYILVQSYEYIRMPLDLSGTCVGKSTYARCGVFINTTPLEPGWHGKLTIEVGNLNPCPVNLYALEGIAQLRFETLTGLPAITYADKGGKYQGQTEPTAPRMK